MDQIVGLLPLVGIFVVFYFFMLRPQMKRQKDQQRFLDSVEKGSEVVTSSGIIGKINKIEGSIIHLQIDPKTFIKMTKNSISKDMTEAYAKSGSVETTAN